MVLRDSATRHRSSQCPLMELIHVLHFSVREEGDTGCDMARLAFRRDSGTSRAHSRRRTSVTFAGVLMCRRGTAPGINTMFGPLPQPPGMGQHFMEMPASLVKTNIFAVHYSRLNGQKTPQEGE